MSTNFSVASIKRVMICFTTLLLAFHRHKVLSLKIYINETYIKMQIIKIGMDINFLVGSVSHKTTTVLIFM